MRELFSFVFLVVILVCVGLIIMIIQPTQHIRACYDTYKVQSEELVFKSKAQVHGMDQSGICMSKQELLLSLGDCLDTIDRGFNQVLTFVKPYLYQSVILLRPGTKLIVDMKSSHDEECAPYPRTTFRFFEQ